MPSCITVGNLWQILRWGTSLPIPLHPWAAPKRPTLNGVNDFYYFIKNANANNFDNDLIWNTSSWGSKLEPKESDYASMYINFEIRNWNWSWNLEKYKVTNSSFMNEIFILRVPNTNLINERSQHSLNFDVPNDNRVSLANKSVRSFGLKIWNSLTLHIKSCKILETFKSYEKLGWRYLQLQSMQNLAI